MPASEQASTTVATEAQREQVAVRAILAMAMGGFAIGTSEFVIMGLLPEVARSLEVTIPQAGHVISYYALGVTVGAPVLAVAGARWPRRLLLMALMLFFAVGNFASALASNYGVLSVLRFTSGLPHGTFFGVAALVAATLAPPGQRARAVGWLMLGLTTATVLGVPLATWVGQLWGWRAAFALVGLLALLAAFLIHRWVPHMPADAKASPMRELGALRRKQVWMTLGIAAIGLGGMFSVYSYVKPIMMEVAGMPLGGVPFVLALFGIGMVVGNMLGAPLADKSLRHTLGGLLMWAFLVLFAFAFTAHSIWLGAFNIFLIGTMVAIGPVLQIRLMDVAGDAQTLAAALNHSAFNVANALGAWLGGLTIAAGLGWTSTAWVGAALAVAGMAMFAWSMKVEERDQRQQAQP